MSEQQQYEDVEIYPAERSASGTNAYYLQGCPVVGHKPSYASCLKKVEDRKHGRLDIQYAECSAAIGKKECRAMKMRKEELAEGQAIYFINRIKLKAFYQYQEEIAAAARPTQGSSVRPSRVAKKETWASVKPSAPPTPPKSEHFLDVEGGGYSAAINAALADTLANGCVPERLASPAPEPKTEPAAMPKPAEQQKQTHAASVKAGMSLIEMARAKLAAKTSQQA